MAAELKTRVELLAAGKDTAGRVLQLKSSQSTLCVPYIHRGDDRLGWGLPLELVPYSHEMDKATGLPVDVERELRIGFVTRLPTMLSPDLAEPTIDKTKTEMWNAARNLCGKPAS